MEGRGARAGQRQGYGIVIRRGKRQTGQEESKGRDYS